MKNGKKSSESGIADIDVNGGCTFYSAEPLNIAALLQDWSVSYITDEPFWTEPDSLGFTVTCTARWS